MSTKWDKTELFTEYLMKAKKSGSTLSETTKNMRNGTDNFSDSGKPIFSVGNDEVNVTAKWQNGVLTKQ